MTGALSPSARKRIAQRFDKALRYQRAGNLHEAERGFAKVVAADPAHAQALHCLALLMHRRGEQNAAMDLLRRAAQADDADASIFNNLANMLRESGRGDEAIATYRQAIGQDPANLNAHFNLCRALLDADSASEALATARQALARFADDLPLLAMQANAQMILGLHKQAEQSFRRWSSISPDDPDAYLGLVRSLTEQHRATEALIACDEFITRFPSAADGFAIKGIVLKYLGRTDEAVSALEHAVAIEPSFAESWNNLGMMAMDLGDMARAQTCFSRALSIQPDSAQTLFNVIRTRRNTDEHRAELEHIEQLARQSSRPVEDRVSLHFALGKAFDDLRESERAFAHYEQGNALHRRSAPFAAADFQRWAQALHETFDAAFFRRIEGFGSRSERPVFIVGMPRSGTSLVEQILASHPQVFGADELPHIIDFAESLHTRVGSAMAYPQAAAALESGIAAELAGEYLAAIDALDTDAIHVTDKMPSNFFHLGLIAAILPNARVIHCVRDPMDSCFSNFIQLFGDLHHYSYSLQHIAVFFNEYQRIMAHWNDVLPLRMHTVSYEALTDDPRAQTQAMLDFLELPFDEACIEFHRTQRVVGTASHWQVRQPIYRTSRQRWRRYENHLRELATAIGYDTSTQDI